MQIVFVLLAHNNPDLIAQLIRSIAQVGHRIIVHVDAKTSDAEFANLSRQVGRSPAVRFAKRVRVEWGEWSVVQATLNCLDEIEVALWDPQYVYLISGMDYPIRSCAQLEAFLERNHGDEFIESVPSDSVNWVKSGPQRERYIYRWYFNWRKSPQLTESAFALQRKVGLRRKFFPGMVPHLGSQWWVLTWTTIKKIRRLAKEPGVVDFFRTTLIPDELFFQTLVRQVADHSRIVSCPLTLYQFSDYGYPVVYHADHLDYLIRQRFFMARKLSPHNNSLRKLLAPYWTGEKVAPSFDDTEVGIRSSEYEDWRLAYREGPPNQPLVAAAALGWRPTQRRIGRPYFVVAGTSTAELRFLSRILARSPSSRMHGLLFDPNTIEFASGAENYAGYGNKDIQLRDGSSTDFLADVVRADGEYTTGFLLRWGHARDLTLTLLQLTNVRFVLLAGDPLVSFYEAVVGNSALPVDPSPQSNLGLTDPTAAANRFRIFLKDYIDHVSVWDQRYDAAKAIKPKGWMEWLNIARANSDWIGRLEHCLGIKLQMTPGEFDDERDRAARQFADMRSSAMELLARGGIDPVAFEVLDREPRNSKIALSFL